MRTDTRPRRVWLAKAIADKMSPTQQDLLHLAAQLLDRLADPDPDRDLEPETDAHAC